MKILVVVDSINIEDSSGSKANVALIKNLAEAGFEVLVYHYTLKNIQLEGIQCIAITEIKYSPLYFLSRLQRILSRSFNINVAPLLEKIFGFSFTFFNDTNSIVRGLKKMTFEPDLVLTLSKGGSFRPHYAVLKCPELHRNWMAYIHDPYPFHFYPRPYTWVESSYKQKEIFFAKVSEKAKYSAFPSQLLLEWMGSFYPNFLKTGVVIPHQNARYEIQNQDFPSYFDMSKFNLLHAGNLMKQRSPEGLIKGFKLFLQNNPEAKKESQLLLLGPASFHAEMLEDYQKNSPEIYIHKGIFAFDEVYHLQKNVAVNIILESKAEISPFLPAKFPHCIAANKMILSLAPYYSETRRLLGNDYEYWSEVDDVKNIANLIEKLYLLWKQNPDNLLLNRSDLEEYLSVAYLKKVINDLENNN
ncbi:UDP-glycosyltransferase [Flavobacterium sp. RSP49]|uniref:UDP-glycosyltransferase n=1 Tax=Flavobacterium sp. RSP49 TaxID=2497487 RepID=UPI000F81F00B|nr:UDP-glycosyltransferase [Flavobacterium sp. RSP49]RTZ02922.1 UDP-glycosyltransferase [Flavobacterium sp. RSP49]